MRSCCCRSIYCHRRRAVSPWFSRRTAEVYRRTQHHPRSSCHLPGTDIRCRRLQPPLLDSLNNQHADQLHLLSDCYGLVLHATGPTHKLGGTLDVGIIHSVTGCPSCVAVEDVGLSDHFLLRWEVSRTRAAVPTTSICCRPWRRLDIERLRSELLASRLCRSDDWPSDVDSLAALYNDELTVLSIAFCQCGSSSVDSGR